MSSLASRFPHGLHQLRTHAVWLGLGAATLAACADNDPPDDSDSQRGSGTDAGRGSSGSRAADAGTPRATVDAGPRATDAARADASRPSSGGAGCMLGEAGSFATDTSLDLFGMTTYFAKGQELPAGRYRVTYVEGCMKYNTLLPWSVNGKLGGTGGWWLVGATNQDRVSMLPGTDDINPLTGFSNFADCVAANQALPAAEFDFKGGKLGIWLDDSPYTDNLSGENGQNPKWQLTLLVDECPPDLILL